MGWRVSGPELWIYLIIDDFGGSMNCTKNCFDTLFMEPD